MPDLLIVSESLEPYVLTYQPDLATDGAIEITALVVLKREDGVLLALPKGALSEEVLERGRLGRAEDVFGPSTLVSVPGVILDGGSVSATGSTFEVLLVDCLSEVVHSLREFRAFEEIIYGFEDGSSFSLPDPAEITSKALAWVEAVAPSLQRVGCYSAQEEPGQTTPRPGTPTLPEEGNTTPRRRKPEKSSNYFRRKAQEGHRCRSCCLDGRSSTGHPNTDFSGGSATSPSSGIRSLSLNNALYGPAYIVKTSWGDTCIDFRSSWNYGKGYPSSPKNSRSSSTWTSGITTGKETNGVGGVGEGEDGPQDRRFLFGTGSACPISGSHHTGEPNCTGLRGPYVRPDGFLCNTWVSRCPWPGKTPIRTCSTSRHLFQFDAGPDVATDESYFGSGAGPQGDVGEGHQWGALPRALRGLWQAKRPRLPTVSGDADLRLFDGREPLGCSGPCCPPHHHTRADEHGWWEDGFGFGCLSSRGPPCIHLPDEAPEFNKSEQSFLPACGSEAHHCCTGLLKGAGCDPKQAFRTGGRRQGKGGLGGRPCPQGEGKGSSKKKAEMEREGGGRGGDLAELFTDDASFEFQDGDHPNPLTSSTTFLRWALSLPRLILRCRTAFSWCLRTSFTAKWQRRSLPTTCLPLPVPHPGCFSSSGSKLSRQRLRKVAYQRLLHVCVLVINYMYLGRFPTLAELGRSPNQWQLRCFQRLRALLHVSGSVPGDIPLVPGRSGFELGATLFQLEQFLAKTPELQNVYASTSPVKMKVDRNLNTVKEFPQLEPYKSLDAGRLKLVGRGNWPMERFFRGVSPFKSHVFFCMVLTLLVLFFPTSSTRARLSPSNWQGFGTAEDYFIWMRDLCNQAIFAGCSTPTSQRSRTDR